MKNLILFLSISLLIFSCKPELMIEMTQVSELEVTYFNGDIDTNTYVIKYRVEKGDTTQPKFNLTEGDLWSEYFNVRWQESQVRCSYVREFKIINQSSWEDTVEINIE